MTLAVVRVRGSVNVNRDIEYTMKLLRLHKVNHCVVIPNTTYYKGMLQKAKDYVTWGEVGEETLTDLIAKYGKVTGDKPQTDAHVKSNTKFKNVKELAKAIHEEKLDYKDVPEIKPIFRLPPPRQ